MNQSSSSPTPRAHGVQPERAPTRLVPLRDERVGRTNAHDRANAHPIGGFGGLKAPIETQKHSPNGSFARARAMAKVVTEQSPHVHVLRKSVAELAESYSTSVPGGPRADPALSFRGEDEETIAFLMTLAAVRFGSGYLPRLEKREGLSAAQTIAASLRERFVAHGPLSAAELEAIDVAGTAKLLGQDEPDAGLVELLDLYARSLRELGRLVRERGAGRCAALVRAADGSAAQLVETLATMPYFKDTQRYRGLELPFQFRAQRCVIEIAQAFDGVGLGRFDDLSQLSPSSDPLVAHVLHVDGVVRYDAPLEQRIERGELVPAHSEREVELRAGALHAVDLLAQELRRRGTDATSFAVDGWLRTRGQGGIYRAKLRHRARTVLY